MNIETFIVKFHEFNTNIVKDRQVKQYQINKVYLCLILQENIQFDILDFKTKKSKKYDFQNLILIAPQDLIDKQQNKVSKHAVPYKQG